MKNSNYKPGTWHDIGGRKVFFRSRWEANYALYLEMQKENKEIADWKFEPYTFWFQEIQRGVRSFKPDFQVFRNDGSHYWVEVKGFLDKKSLTKLNRMRIYYPDEEIVLVDGNWFNQHKYLASTIKGWS